MDKCDFSLGTGDRVIIVLLVVIPLMIWGEVTLGEEIIIAYWF